MVGPDWPNGGEIDIFEGVNQQTNNAMTLHTDATCTHDDTLSQTGTTTYANCDVTAGGGANLGCGVQDPSKDSFGQCEFCLVAPRHPGYFAS